MISCTVEEAGFIIFMNDGVEIYDINMNVIRNESEFDLKIKEMRNKNWVTPSMLDHIEKTIRQYMRHEAIA